MAQSGYTPILIYASGTATNVPLAANMTSVATGAELAINYTDGKLYYKNNSGVVTLLASSSGASGDVVGPASVTDNALARFDLTTGKLIQNSVGILSDAGILTGLTGLTSSGSITLSSLTSGQVTYAGTAGLLQDSANLTFNGTTLTANTIGAYTLSGTIAGGGNQINNVIIGTSTPLAGSFSTLSASGVATFSAGTVALPAITTTGDTNTGIFFPAADTIAFTEGGAESMRINSSGDVGIGLDNPTRKLHVKGSTGLVQFESTTSSCYVYVGDSTSTGIDNQGIASTGNNLLLISGGSEAMRTDTNRNLLVGGTTQRNAAKFTLEYNGSTNNGIAIIETAVASGTEFLTFVNPAGTNIGTVSRVGVTDAVIYNTTSDQRLKSNIADASPVLEKLMTVKVRQFDWTEGNSHQDAGFIAQELEPVLSGIVTQGKTEEDMWQMDYSRLTPYLLKAIQEQQTLIELLTTRLTALENK